MLKRSSSAQKSLLQLLVVTAKRARQRLRLAKINQSVTSPLTANLIKVKPPKVKSISSVVDSTLAQSARNKIPTPEGAVDKAHFAADQKVGNVTFTCEISN